MRDKGKGANVALPHHPLLLLRLARWALPAKPHQSRNSRESRRHLARILVLIRGRTAFVCAATGQVIHRCSLRGSPETIITSCYCFPDVVIVLCSPAPYCLRQRALPSNGPYLFRYQFHNPFSSSGQGVNPSENRFRHNPTFSHFFLF